MRQPIRQRRKSKDWMVTYGLTTLFVVGSLWYLDLLPLDGLLNSGSSGTSQTQLDSGGAQPTDDQPAAEAALSGIEQWEPEVTTTGEVPPDMQFSFQEPPSNPERPEFAADSQPVTPASFAKVTPSSSAALPFPPAPETGRREPVGTETTPPDSLTEQERISRIFNSAGTVPETRTERPVTPEASTTDSQIIPTSAEKPAVPRLPETDGSFEQVDQWIAEGQYLKAHRELSQRYWKEEDSLEPLLKRLNKTAGMIYFAPKPDFMKAYVIQQGDLLQSIAPQYKLSWEYLARLNRVRPERIRPGQELKVIKGPFSAFIDLSEFALTIHAHGYFVKRYSIGIGKDNSTPIGTYSVKEKLKNPKYYGSDEVIEADDPTNPLGERWISIGDSYGIHGTIDPTSIGKAASRGCLRLTNDDVVEVYDFLIPGSEVVIRP